MAIMGYAGKAVDADKIFAAENWSNKILSFNHENSVIEKMVNKDYEGEVNERGSIVHIARSIAPIVKPYLRSQELEFQNEEVPETQLVVDKAFYAGNYVEPIDNLHSAVKRMDMWVSEVGYGFAQNKDKLILNDVFTEIDPENRGDAAGRVSKNINLGVTGAPLVIDITNCLTTIMDMGLVMDEAANADDRFLTIPNRWFNLARKAMMSDSFYSGGKQVLEKGALPFEIGGFKVYNTNNYEPVTDGTDTCFNIVGGRKSGITMAEKMVEQRESRDAKTPGLFRFHLEALGYKVIQPTHLVGAYVTFA